MKREAMERFYGRLLATGGPEALARELAENTRDDAAVARRLVEGGATARARARLERMGRRGQVALELLQGWEDPDAPPAGDAGPGRRLSAAEAVERARALGDEDGA